MMMSVMVVISGNLLFIVKIMFDQWKFWLCL